MTTEQSREIHILECKELLSESQYTRLKEQCSEQFGKGNFLLLEGGVKHCGKTTIVEPSRESLLAVLESPECVEEVAEAIHQSRNVNNSFADTQHEATPNQVKVSVSLEKCAFAASNLRAHKGMPDAYDYEITKAILEAAKAQGARFDYVE